VSSILFDPHLFFCGSRSARAEGYDRATHFIRSIGPVHQSRSGPNRRPKRENPWTEDWTEVTLAGSKSTYLQFNNTKIKKRAILAVFWITVKLVKVDDSNEPYPNWKEISWHAFMYDFVQNLSFSIIIHITHCNCSFIFCKIELVILIQHGKSGPIFSNEIICHYLLLFVTLCHVTCMVP